MVARGVLVFGITLHERDGMSVNTADVAKIASLARIKVSEAQLEAMVPNSTAFSPGWSNWAKWT
jgi:hypothetical protein